MSITERGSDPRDAVIVDERPWGRFEQLTQNQATTVKIITVEAGHRLSLQRHRHRDELWTILDVPLLVEVDGRAWTAEVGEKVWVPRESVHRVSATGGATGRFLEIAFGPFDEADIERLADDYTR